MGCENSQLTEATPHPVNSLPQEQEAKPVCQPQGSLEQSPHTSINVVPPHADKENAAPKAPLRQAESKKGAEEPDVGLAELKTKKSKSEKHPNVPLSEVTNGPKEKGD
jgi:hypothetical protein